MNTNIKYVADMAALAEASYAGLDRFNSNQNGLKSAIISNGFSVTHADDFTQNWSVISGSHQANMPSGFSATLFKEDNEVSNPIFFLSLC